MGPSGPSGEGAAMYCDVVPDNHLRIISKTTEEKHGIRAEANMETVESMLRRRRLRWLGHVARMGTERIPRQLLVCKPEGGKRTAGGQKLRWADVVSNNLKGVK